MKTRTDKHSYGSGYFDGTLEEGHRWKAKVEALRVALSIAHGDLRRIRTIARNQRDYGAESVALSAIGRIDTVLADDAKPRRSHDCTVRCLENPCPRRAP